MRICLQNINFLVKNVLSYEIPNTCPVMYPENTQEIMTDNLHLAYVLLAASKKAVTTNSLNANSPKEEQWLKIVQGICDMERLTYMLRLKGNKFEKN